MGADWRGAKACGGRRLNGHADAAAGGGRRDVEVEQALGVRGQGASIGESVGWPSYIARAAPILAVTTVLQRLAYWEHVCSTASMFASLPTGRLGGLMARAGTMIRTVCV